jgi:hypothetical protein
MRTRDRRGELEMSTLVALAFFGTPIQGKPETAIFEAESLRNPDDPKVWRNRGPGGADFHLTLAWPERKTTLKFSGVFQAGHAFMTKLDLHVADERSEIIRIRAIEHSTAHVVVCPNGTDQRNAHVLSVIGCSTYAELDLGDDRKLVFSDEHRKQVRLLALQVFRVLSEQAGLPPSQRPYMANSIVAPGRPHDPGFLKSLTDRQE